MKKLLFKSGIITLLFILFSVPTFASNNNSITAIIDRPSSSVFKTLQSKTMEALNDALIRKQIAENARKAELKIKLDESRENIAKREAEEASGKVAAEHKNAVEGNTSTSTKQNVAPMARAQAQAKKSINAEVNTADSKSDVQNNDSDDNSTTINDNTEASQTETPKPQDTSTVDNTIIPANSLGIDVSQFNGNIDWKSVANSGVKFAFIRVAGRYSVSGTIYNDEKFEYNISQAKANGIKVGVYFFTQAVNNNEAIEEARYAIQKIKPYGIDLPIVIDSESVCGGGRHSAISLESRTEVVKAFCNEVSNAGYTPMIYASTWWLENKLDMSKLSGYKVWVAQYYNKVTYTGSYNVWQYTSTGSITGISGNVDCNYWYN